MQTGAGLTFPPENVTVKCAVRNQLFCRKTKKLKNWKDVSSEILIYEKPRAKLNFVLVHLTVTKSAAFFNLREKFSSQTYVSFRKSE